MVRIINNKDFGGFYTTEFAENNPEITQDWTFTDVEPNSELIKPKWNGTIWIEGSSIQEIEEYNASKVPTEISRLKFKLQIRRSTIYNYDIILAYLQNLPTNVNFTEDDKAELIDRLEDAVSFNRYHPDFINLANMLGVSDEIKDEIFINGNLID